MDEPCVLLLMMLLKPKAYTFVVNESLGFAYTDRNTCTAGKSLG